MQLTSTSLTAGKPIPKQNAMGVPAEGGPVPGPNKSPHLAWSGAPEGTRSYCVLCIDADAPTVPDDVNKEGRTVPYDLPRANFVHWVLVDIPPSITELKEGLDADGLTPKGKSLGHTPYGVRGLNDYTSWFAGDADMGGDYGGYDGPWPPFNDERVHRYTFSVYALDVVSVGLSGKFTADDVKKAIAGHVLAEASIETTYAINANAR